MEYAGALRVVIFNKSCCLRNLTEAQVGRNQFAMDVVVDWLDERINEVDGRVDHASEQLSVLEGKVADMEGGYMELLALGREQVETSTRSCWALASLATVVVAQQQKILQVEERMDMMREMILVLEHMQENPIMVNEGSDRETVVSDGVTGSEGWCSHLVHHKYIARKWTKYQPNTHPGYCKYIQNIPSQFPCNCQDMISLNFLFSTNSMLISLNPFPFAVADIFMTLQIHHS